MWGQKYEQLGFDDRTASVLDIDRVQEVIKRRAERYNIKVTWSNKNQTALTRNAPSGAGYDYEVVLPAIASPCMKEDLIRTYMYVVHECGHLIRNKVWDISIAAQPNEIHQAIFNIVEDDSMERDIANRHLGDARTLGEGNAIMCKDGEIYWSEEVAKARAKGIPFDEESLKPMIVMGISMLSRKEWDGWSREAIQDWLKVMPEEGQPLMTTLVKEGWVDKFRNTKTEYDSWNVACDLYDRLYPTDDEKEQQEREEIREAGNTGQQRVVDEGNTFEDVDKPRDGDNARDKDGSELSDGQAQVDEDAQGYVISWTGVVMSEHKNEDGYANGGPIGITFNGKAASYNDVRFMPDHMSNVIDLTVKDASVPVEAWRRKGKAPQNFMVNDKSATVLANQIRQYVQSQSRVKFRAERESGKLNSKDVTRLLLPPIEGGNWNRKVFYDRVNKRHLNTAVHILVDWSGSMNGDKQVYAAAACMRAVDVFSRCLRMPVMVTSFTTAHHANDLAIIKHFDTMANQKQMAERFGEWCKYTGANNDADAIMWAYRRLMERKEPRKLLIVMSDGAPAGSYSGDYHSALLMASRHIQDEGKVEVFGLGIKSGAVKNYYDNFEVVNNLSDINQALLDVIKRSINYERH